MISKNYLKMLTIVFMVTTVSSMGQTWERLADIPEQLAFPVVAVLDSQIHVMGGGAAGGATGAHYSYDPTTNIWHTLQPVPYLAQQPAGAAVAGKIHYFGGGFPNSGSPLNDHYIYDPVSDTWSPAADLTTARAIHYAINLRDTLYSMTGQGMKDLFEQYNTGTDNWSQKSDLPDLNFFYGAHVTHGGKIYRFGGGGYLAPKDDAHVYDPTTDQWTILPKLPDGSHGLSGVAMGDSIYLLGGYNIFPLKEVWIYNIDSQTYSQGLELPEERNYHRTVNIGDCIYVVGGSGYHDSLQTMLLRYCLGSEDDTTTTKIEQVYSNDLILQTFQGKIEIMVPANISGKDLEISVFDLLGRTVYSESNSQTHIRKIEVPTYQLPSSIFVIQLRTESDRISKKFHISR